MAEHFYTVTVHKNNNAIPAQEFYGIRANSKEGAIDRAVDMFRVSKDECRATQEDK